MCEQTLSRFSSGLSNSTSRYFLESFALSEETFAKIIILTHIPTYDMFYDAPAWERYLSILFSIFIILIIINMLPQKGIQNKVRNVSDIY